MYVSILYQCHSEKISIYLITSRYDLIGIEIFVHFDELPLAHACLYKSDIIVEKL